MPKLKKIIEKVNKDNAPPDGWQPKDAVTKFSLRQILQAWTTVYGEDMQTEYPGFISHLKKQDKPEAGKLYALTGGPGSKCIANGNTWEESVVGEEVKP
tara:strand:- start:205 stop:501 length:297 start_codon:yes stop_codon:yes gene_type:complete